MKCYSTAIMIQTSAVCVVCVRGVSMAYFGYNPPPPNHSSIPSTTAHSRCARRMAASELLCSSDRPVTRSNMDSYAAATPPALAADEAESGGAAPSPTAPHESVSHTTSATKRAPCAAYAARTGPEQPGQCGNAGACASIGMMCDSQPRIWCGARPRGEAHAAVSGAAPSGGAEKRAGWCISVTSSSTASADAMGAAPARVTVQF